jgi:gamma-glutamyl hercynylcysteine S-oxide synthase
MGLLMSQRQQWLDSLQRWHIAEKNKLQYNGNEYTGKEFSGVNTAFRYARMMAHDRYFYDPVIRKYTVDRYLNDLEQRYGGLLKLKRSCKKVGCYFYGQ